VQQCHQTDSGGHGVENVPMIHGREKCISPGHDIFPQKSALQPLDFFPRVIYNIGRGFLYPSSKSF
ncbi:MAG: hypothetical protein ABS888_07030, partial [Eubacteriales bacterium]